MSESIACRALEKCSIHQRVFLHASTVAIWANLPLVTFPTNKEIRPALAGKKVRMSVAEEAAAERLTIIPRALIAIGTAAAEAYSSVDAHVATKEIARRLDLFADFSAQVVSLVSTGHDSTLFAVFFACGTEQIGNLRGLTFDSRL